MPTVIFEKSRAMSLNIFRRITKIDARRALFSAPAAPWLAPPGGQRGNGRIILDPHLGRLAEGPGSNEYGSGGDLSVPFHAYRPGRHGGICRRSQPSLQRLSVRPVPAPRIPTQRHRRASFTRYSRRDCRAAAGRQNVWMVGGLLPADGLSRPLGHQDFHPLYQEASRLGCMLAVHAQNSLRNNDLFLWRHEAATLAHVWPQMRQFTNLMFSGVVGKLPDLRLAFLEAGCGWVPYLLSKMEPRMADLVRPSKLIERGQVYFQCGEEMTTKTPGGSLFILGVRFSSRRHRGHEQGRQGVCRTRRYSRRSEAQDQLRQSQSALSPLKQCSLQNRDDLHLEQHLAAQVRFQGVTRRAVVFIGKHF
jgi:hypothetical protein